MAKTEVMILIIVSTYTILKIWSPEIRYLDSTCVEGSTEQETEMVDCVTCMDVVKGQSGVIHINAEMEEVNYAMWVEDGCMEYSCGGLLFVNDFYAMKEENSLKMQTLGFHLLGRGNSSTLTYSSINSPSSWVQDAIGKIFPLFSHHVKSILVRYRYITHHTTTITQPTVKVRSQELSPIIEIILLCGMLCLTKPSPEYFIALSLAVISPPIGCLVMLTVYGCRFSFGWVLAILYGCSIVLSSTPLLYLIILVVFIHELTINPSIPHNVFLLWLMLVLTIGYCFSISIIVGYSPIIMITYIKYSMEKATPIIPTHERIKQSEQSSEPE